ncbi:MAG: VOC family protein [Rhodospirillaceae bacterium]|nr:VOC family protein [Rhodospirillaceae bacterium]
MINRRTLMLTSAAFASTAGAHAQSTSANKLPDHMDPRPVEGEPLAGPLHTVTIITPDLAALLKLYRDGLGLTHAGPLPMTPATAQALGNLWGMPADLPFEVHTLTRPAAPTATRIRVLVTARPTPPIRQSWSRQELGPYGMGFPNTDVASWDRHVLDLGFTRATDEIERFPLKASDGSNYEVQEATFNGPEFLRAIAISRGGGMAQVGDMDPATGRGGPAYATQVLAEDGMDAMIAFLTNVLDFEVRSDRIWRAYAIPFRFATVHARGATTGHVALASYAREHVEPGTGNAPAPPHRGMAMWSFSVRDIEAIAARARDHGAPVLAGPAGVDSPDLGRVTALTVKAPNGFVVEVFQPG